MKMAGKNKAGWPYHQDPHGNMVPCASNPCTLHGGNDVIASSPEEAEAKWQHAHNGDMTIGLNASNDSKTKDESIKTIHNGNAIGFAKASYEAAETTGAKNTSSVTFEHVKSFFSKHISNNGMLTGIDGNKKALHELGLLSYGKINDDTQKYMLKMSREHMLEALNEVDYNKLPAATESWSALANNPSTSKENLHELTEIATENSKNPNFSKQVHVSDLVNNSNLASSDANKLYRHFPSETVSAQHCPQEILNKAITDPSTPARVRQVALRNPNAPANEVKIALLSSDNVSKASALMNPRSASFFAENDNDTMPTLFDDSENEKPFSKSEIDSAMKAFKRMKANAGMKSE